MSGPAQRAAQRQAARRAALSATRPTAAQRSRGRVGVAVGAVRDRPSLTGRAVVLALVVGLLVLSLAVPARELFRQRAEINALRAANADAQGRVAALQVQRRQLSDPVYVTSLVRERLHYVLPGEVGYVVLDPTEAPAPGAAKTAPVARPVWSTLWSAVQTADQAGRPADPAAIPVRSDAPR